MWLVGLYALVLVGCLIAATVYDVRSAYKLQAERLKLIDKMIAAPRGSSSYSQVIQGYMKSPTRGIQGLTRGLIGLTILASVSLALAIAMVSYGAGADDLRRTIVAALLGVLGTIVGFYFGSRTAESSADAASERLNRRNRPDNVNQDGERAAAIPAEAAIKAALHADAVGAEAKRAEDAATAAQRKAAHARSVAVAARAEANRLAGLAIANPNDAAAAKDAEQQALTAEQEAVEAEGQAAVAVHERDGTATKAADARTAADAALADAKAVRQGRDAAVAAQAQVDAAKAAGKAGAGGP